MERSFADIIGDVFDNSESIDFRSSETPLGEYEYARISDVNSNTARSQVEELQSEGIEATTVEASNGLEVEAWS